MTSASIRGGVVLAIAVLATAGLGSGKAYAAPPKETPLPKAPVVSVYANPIFGPDSTSGSGWSEIVTRIENNSATTQKGTVELLCSPNYGNGDKFIAKAPFSVPVGHSAVVRLPTHGSTSYSPVVVITAYGEKSEKLAATTLTLNTTTAPLLVDVDQPSRLGVAMRTWSIPTPWNGTSSGYYGGSGSNAQPLAVGAPAFDRTSGDPILPEHAAGYSAATAVLIHSDALARLDPGALDALVNWTLAGGTMAVIPNRPEDLRGPVLTALVGGTVTKIDVPGHMLTLPGQMKPPSGGSGGFDPDDTNDPPPGAGGSNDPTDPSLTPPQQAAPLKFNFGGPLKLTPMTRPMPIQRTGPPAKVKESLAGYTGGNLHESDFGATASYGLGEVHLLAFDPTIAPMLDDPWVHGRIVDLLARAWDRHALNAFWEGSGERGSSRNEEVRRELDPNENFRPGLGISAILLVIYSIIAGPMTFARAAKKGTPLSPLKWAPIWSVAAFSLIVFVGFASKGFRGRARHLSVVEAGAGVTRGSIRRFRGFFASETRSLAVPATDRTCVLDTANADSTHQDAVLRLDRNGATLENLTSLPWQTVIVREDGFIDFKGGISVIPTPDGSADVVNHSGLTLKDVLVWMPSEGLTYFPEVKEGSKVHAVDGKNVLKPSARRPSTGPRPVHPLQASDLRFSGLRNTDKFEKSWIAVEAAAGDAVDWLPDDVPIVMGEMTGGPRAGNDSGLSLEDDRVLFRVIGRGGAR